MLLFMPKAMGAGWIIQAIKTEFIPSKVSMQTTNYFYQNMVKTLLEGSIAIIVKYSENKLYVVNSSKRVYWSGTPSKYIQILKKNAQQAMRNIPYKEEENKGGSNYPNTKVKIIRTPEKQTIAGYAARKYLIYADDKNYEELWLSEEIDLERYIDMGAIMELKRKLSKTFSSLDIQYEKELLESGFPLKKVLVIGGEVVDVTQVISARKSYISTDEFRIPKSYRRVGLDKVF